MRWFRSKIHFGTGLALITLALQLVLTFGHVHAPTSTSVGSALSSGKTASSEPGSRHPANSNGLADADCATCALIQLSSAATPSLAPNLPLPASNDFITLRPHAELASDTSPHFSGQGPRTALRLRRAPAIGLRSHQGNSRTSRRQASNEVRLRPSVTQFHLDETVACSSIPPPRPSPRIIGRSRPRTGFARRARVTPAKALAYFLA